MKITVYTITDCEFSKQEKEYLASHQLQYEEKNLETNKDFLTEMLAVSNNFAGTPVTKIEKDDGKIEILKGFTPEEFNKTLGFTEPKKEEPSKGGKKPEEKEAKTEPSAPPAAVETPQAQPVQDQPVQSTPQSTPPSSSTNSPADSNRPASQAGPTSTDSTVSDPLNSILADLQAKSVASNLNSPTDSNRTADSTGPIPTDSKPSSVPSVPDFPAKI